MTTTAVRIESVLESSLHLIPLMVGVDNDSADIGGMDAAAQKIAAEIDALTRERDEARAEVARLTPLSEIHDAWRELHEGKESPSEESVVRFIEFAHAAAGRAYEAAKGTP